MTVPKKERLNLRRKLWKQADDLGWMNLSPTDKTKHYEYWVEDAEIGGRLGRFMPQRKIRTYIKDSLMKGYARAQLEDPERPLRALGKTEEAVAGEYVKPHGRKLNEDEIVCWGRATGWKHVLMAAHERAFELNGTVSGVVFLHSHGKYRQEDTRSMVEDAATKLGVDEVVWLE